MEPDNHTAQPDKDKRIKQLEEEVTRLRRDLTLKAQKEHIFNAVLNDFPEFIAYTDKNLTYRFVNKAYEHAFKVNAGSIIGKKLPGFIGRKAYEKARPYIEKVLSGQEVRYTERFEYPGNLIKYIQGHLVPDRNEHDEVLGYWAFLRDITELENTRKAYRTLVEDSIQGLVILQNGRIVFANQKISELSGYTHEEMLSWSWEEIINTSYSEDREIILQSIQQLLEGSKPVLELEFRVKRKNEALRWVHAFASRISFRENPAIQIAYLDVTENKILHDQLVKSERLLRLTNDNLQDIIWQMDPYGTFTYISPSVKKIYGYKPEEVIGHNVLDLIAPEDRETAMENMRKRAQGHELDTWYSVYKLLRKDKIPVHVEVTSAPIFNDQNEIMGFSGVSRDISERIRIEKKLRESENRFHTIFEEDKLVKLIINPQTGQIEDANKAALEFYGYSYNTLTSMRIQDINILPDGQVKDEMNQALRHHKNTFLFKHQLASGEIREVEVYSNPLEFSSGKKLFSIIQDVTHLQKKNGKSGNLPRPLNKAMP